MPDDNKEQVDLISKQPLEGSGTGSSDIRFRRTKDSEKLASQEEHRT